MSEQKNKFFTELGKHKSKTKSQVNHGTEKLGFYYYELFLNQTVHCHISTPSKFLPKCTWYLWTYGAYFARPFTTISETVEKLIEIYHASNRLVVLELPLWPSHPSPRHGPFCHQHLKWQQLGLHSPHTLPHVDH